MNHSLTGGCLCGEIRYELATPIEQLVQCHCRSCQQGSGAGASVNAMIASKDLEFVKGEPKVYIDTAASGNRLFRAFCANCGSPIYSQREATPERRTLRAGSMDDSNAARIVMNIWTRSARPWAYIDPGLLSHEGNRPA